jgi:hypothetical protein
MPAPSQFAKDNGTKWTVEFVGQLQFTDRLQKDKLMGDKCRTGKVGDRVIWNCGDMMCNGSVDVCGFSMGPAFYGTDSVMTVDTDGVDNVNDNVFVQPWSGDTKFASPYTAWGMDTSNVAPVNATHGVAYAWEIWRGAPDDEKISNRGNAVASVTLGDTKPVATRVGPLLTGPDAVSLGLLAILRAGDYIYTYSKGGPSKLMVGRVAVDASGDDVFDADKYEFLAADTDDTWVSGIPSSSSTSVGATTANPSGQFGCDVYGSVAYNNYLHKYVLLCDIFLSFVNMYTADTPFGPWSAEYSILTGGRIQGSYGSMMHPEYTPPDSRNDESFYFSLGPNGVFNMFQLTFKY